jgi:DNA-binding LacI/PurR family transcriptional regulator
MERLVDDTQKSKRRPTSHDVAKLAGVSQATVSLVMSQKGRGVGISEDTERRVLEAARSLSYYPNSLMRSLRRGRTGIIGAFAHDTGWANKNSYWVEAIAGLHRAATEMGQELLLFSDTPGRTREQLLERMLSGTLDGIVAQHGEHTEVLERLRESGLPMVCIGDPYPGVPSVGIENIGGIERLVEHLAERGHRRVGFMNLPQVSQPAPAERERSFLDTCRRLGLEAPEELVFRIATWDIESMPNRLLAIGTRPTAMVCFNDEWAYLLVRACLARGMRVPEDLAVTGFDGIPVPFAPKTVTTMKSPIYEMCDLAVRKLLDVIEDRPVEVRTVLPVEFVQGDTT